MTYRLGDRVEDALLCGWDVWWEGLHCAVDRYGRGAQGAQLSQRLAQCQPGAVLAVARTVQARTGLSVRNVTRQLRPLRSATIAINSAVQTFPPHIDDEQQALLDALNPTPLTH